MLLSDCISALYGSYKDFIRRELPATKAVSRGTFFRYMNALPAGRRTLYLPLPVNVDSHASRHSCVCMSCRDGMDSWEILRTIAVRLPQHERVLSTIDKTSAHFLSTFASHLETGDTIVREHDMRYALDEKCPSTLHNGVRCAPCHGIEKVYAELMQLVEHAQQIDDIEASELSEIKVPPPHTHSSRILLSLDVSGRD